MKIYRTLDESFTLTNDKLFKIVKNAYKRCLRIPSRGIGKNIDDTYASAYSALILACGEFPQNPQIDWQNGFIAGFDYGIYTGQVRIIRQLNSPVVYSPQVNQPINPNQYNIQIAAAILAQNNSKIFLQGFDTGDKIAVAVFAWIHENQSDAPIWDGSEIVIPEYSNGERITKTVKNP